MTNICSICCIMPCKRLRRAPAMSDFVMKGLPSFNFAAIAMGVAFFGDGKACMSVSDIMTVFVTFVLAMQATDCIAILTRLRCNRRLREQVGVTLLKCRGAIGRRLVAGLLEEHRILSATYRGRRTSIPLTVRDKLLAFCNEQFSQLLLESRDVQRVGRNYPCFVKQMILDLTTRQGVDCKKIKWMPVLKMFCIFMRQLKVPRSDVVCRIELAQELHDSASLLQIELAQELIELAQD